MNKEELIQRLASDNWWRKNFLVFHSQHLHLTWDQALEAYLANDRSLRDDWENYPDFNEYLTGFIQSSRHSDKQDLSGYVQAFASQALQNQQKLSEEYKQLIYDLTTLHLADHYRQSVDGIQEKVYQSLKKLPQGRAFEVVAKFSQNIANKISEDFENYVRAVEEQEKAKEKALNQTDSEQNKKNEKTIGDLPDEQEAAPLPNASESQSLNDLSPSQTHSHSLLHFTLNDREKSSFKRNYHIITDKELTKLNRRAGDLQNVARWYRENLADKKIHYVYKDGEDFLKVRIDFEKRHFMHLTGLSPIKEGQTSEQTLIDFADGNGEFDNLLIANNNAAFDKLKVLPDLESIVDSTSFYFTDVSQIAKLNKLHLETAITANDSDLLLALKSSDDIYIPASVMKLSHRFHSELDRLDSKKEILEVISEKDGVFEVLSYNENYISDQGQELLNFVKNNEFTDYPSDFIPTPEQESRFNELIDFITAEDYYLWYEDSLTEAGYPDEAFVELNSRISAIDLSKEQSLNGALWVEESSNDGATGYLSLNGSNIDDTSINQYLDELELNNFQERLDKLEELSAALEKTWEEVQEKADLIFEDIQKEYGATTTENEVEELKGIRLNWTELPGENNQYFNNFDELQQFLKDGFYRENSDDLYYDKTSLTFEWTKDGETVSSEKTERIDVGLRKNDFNPYTESISDYLADVVGSIPDEKAAHLPRHALDPVSRSLFNGVYVLSVIDRGFDSITNAYETLEGFERFKTAYPTLNDYVVHIMQIEQAQRDEIEHEEKGLSYLLEKYPMDTKVLYNERAFKIQSIRQNPEGNFQVNLAPWTISGLVDIEPILIYPTAEAVEAGLERTETSPETQEETKIDSWAGIAMLREEYPFKTPVTYEGESHLVIGSGYQSQEEQYFIRLQPTSGGQVVGQNPMIVGKSPQAVLDQMRRLREQVRESQEVADRAYARQDLRDGFVRDRVADEQGDISKEQAREENEEAREEYREEALAEQVQTPVSAPDFTLVLDAAYNVGEPRKLGTTPPEESIPAWNLYYDMVDRLGNLDAVVAEAETQGLLDKDSNFFREYQEDFIRENPPSFRFPDDLSNFYPKTPTEKVAANIEAISLVKLLEYQSRQATPEEQEILAKYVGWGGLANEFFNESNPKFSDQRQELKSLVSDKEYAAMRESSLTAYYTDPAIVKEMYQKLLDDGFTGGRILDPSMGTGTFFAAMPEEIRQNSELYGVELDTITGAIAKQLHPDANISIKGFEEMNFNEKSFDLVMSNIPFADMKITDKAYDKPYMIHDYFIRKSMDLVRDGGVVNVISSTGTMDKRVGNIMKELAGEDINFLGGVRLPDTAFKAIAGTDVTTDILYFQKNEGGERTAQSELAFAAPVQDALDGRIWTNPYFEGENQVIGDYQVKNYNGGTLSVRYLGDDLIGDLHEALQHIAPMAIKDVTPDPDVMKETDKASITDVPVEYLERIPSYSYEMFDGKVFFKDGKSISDVRMGAKMEQISYYIDQNGEFHSWDSKFSEKFIENFEQLNVTDDSALDVYVSDIPAPRGKYAGLYKKTVFFEQPFTEREADRAKGMIRIRDTYLAMIDLQRDPDYSREHFADLLGILNREYDSFVAEFGNINAPTNRNLFDEDDRYSLIASLEDYSELDDSYSKSAVFEKPMIRPDKPEIKVDNAMDALQISLSEGRGVDFEFMSGLYRGKSPEEIQEELGEAIAPDPLAALEGKVQYESRHHFVSGDVVDKLEAVEQLISQEDTSQDWIRYRSILEEAQPPRVHLTDIDFKIGSRWIPTEVYEMFAANTFTHEQYSLDRIQSLNRSTITTNPLTGEYTVGSMYLYGNLNSNYHNLGVRGTRYDTGLVVFNNLLNNEQKTIMTKDEDGRSILNAEATAALRGREEELQSLFQEFVRNTPDVQNVLEDTYNSVFNRTVSRTYDGSALEIDGLASNIELREHQKNAVQRIIEERRALLAHEVGSGKTLTMLGAGFKMKELGMVNKPMYVVPSSLTAQFGQEIAKFFPTKNVYVTTPKDFVKAKRKQFISRINTGDYDAVVIGASQFEKIPVSQERREQHILEKLDELRAVKDEMKGNSPTQKQLIRMEKSLEFQLKELQNLQQDSFIEFENLGVDMLFVDEAHGFKNVRPMTNLSNVAGITNTTAKKNMDMELKIRHIQEEHDGRNVVFATGTPVSNSISEIFTMMNYIQPDVLEKHHIDKFDAWVGAFGNIENSMELNPTGDKYIAKQRFKEFTNLPELMRIYKESADIQTSDMLDLPVPEHEVKKVVSELTPNQKEYLDFLVKRTEKIQSGGVDPSKDNMLKITSEARKLAIDMRLLDSKGYNIKDNEKIMQVVDNVERIYREGENTKATQMIFSDIGTPKSGNNTSTFDVYAEIKDLLVERGIPKDQIAFVHDANTDAKKNALSRKVNAGDVRILLASTEKGGTGLNVQAKMKAVHHIDVPWRPSDIIQRNGRLIRQGNEHQNVEIYHYITKGSFDNYLWQTQENKLRYITQMMTSKDPVRAMSDIDDQIMTTSDFKAEATGNPFLKAKMTLENELTTLSSQRRAFERDQDSARQTLAAAERDLPTLNKRLENYAGDLKRVENNVQSEFSITLAGQIFDKKSEAGLALHDLLRNNISDDLEVRTLGQYRGFDIRAKTMTPFEAVHMNAEDQLGSMMFSINVRGENTYPVTLDLASGLGTIQRINNVIDSIEVDQEKTLKKRDNLIEKSAAAKEMLGKTFAKEDDYLHVKGKLDFLKPLVESGKSGDEIRKAIEEKERQSKQGDQKGNSQCQLEL